MAEITLIEGRSEVRSNIADAFFALAEHLTEEPVRLAGAFAERSIQSVERYDMNTGDILWAPVREVFGDYTYPTTPDSRSQIGWQMDGAVYELYRAWSGTQQYDTNKIIGLAIQNKLAHKIKRLGPELGIEIVRFSIRDSNLERMLQEIESRRVHGNGSLRSQEAMQGSFGSCLDRGPNW